MHNFKELKVWQAARVLVKEVYQASYGFPEEEKFGLTNQVRRSAISIPSNVAEGCGRRTTKDFIHFLSVSLGSSFELETQIILSLDLGYINEMKFKELEDQIHQVQKMLNGLITNLESKLPNSGS